MIIPVVVLGLQATETHSGLSERGFTGSFVQEKPGNQAREGKHPGDIQDPGSPGGRGLMELGEEAPGSPGQEVGMARPAGLPLVPGSSAEEQD